LFEDLDGWSGSFARTFQRRLMLMIVTGQLTVFLARTRICEFEANDDVF
jgi:hypothetical protein